LPEVDLLVVNPWIYDFSAHDFWLKPYGLLSLGGLLRAKGYKVHYIDLLDPFHQGLPKPPKRKDFGTGHFYKEPVAKPSSLRDIPRKYYRYGLPYQLAKDLLSSVKPKAILTGITMTYWYPGLFVLLKLLVKLFPETPIFVGGIYARLCQEHLKDFLTKEALHQVIVFSGGSRASALKLIESYVKPSCPPSPLNYPIFDLQTAIPYVVLLTSEGCPYHCPYCASRLLYERFTTFPPMRIVEEIEFWHKNYGVVDFAFYDDALLFKFDEHLKPILTGVLERGLRVRFHTPNALHARFINKEVAELLREAGFKTIRLGLERVDNRFDSKVKKEEFVEAVRHLRAAGFETRDLGAYVIFGVPEEDFLEVEKTLHFLYELKVQPYLAEFSPVPGTPFFELCRETSRYPIDEDPIFHNKSLFSALKKPDWEKINSLKNLARSIRRAILQAV